MIELNSRNIKLYAARHYTNSACLGEEEFTKDFNLANKIDLMFNKQNQDIRKIINMVITYYNVFEFEAATRILFYNSDHKEKLKTLLVVLNRFPSSLDYVYPYEIDIDLLEKLKKELR